MTLRLAATWEPAALHLLCVVSDPSGAPPAPPVNVQEGDGLEFAVADTAGGIAHELRLEARPEPPRCVRVTGEAPAAAPMVTASRGRAPAETWYALRIPVAQIGREGLARGDEISCDLHFQESTADRGRAAVQWAGALRCRSQLRWARIRLV